MHEEFIDFKSIGNDEIDLEEAVHAVYDDGQKNTEWTPSGTFCRL